MKGSHNRVDSNIIISFNNESLIPNLFGQFDKNLRRIEYLLNVNLHGRGKNVSISGEKVLLAKNVLNDLYGQLEKGFDIDSEEVDASIRMNSVDNNFLKKMEDNTPLIRTEKKTVRARTHTQNQYINALNISELTFGVGPAGTGKTYLPVAHAVEMLEKEEVSKIILSRPAVEAGEKLGFLPGDLAQKIDPYLRPLYDALYEMVGFETVVRMIEKNIIEIAPLAYMRGRTLNDSFVILDESQNTTREQMKMFLTRIGFGSTAVITGDVTQIDLPKGTASGLKHAIEVLDGINGIGFTHFLSGDIVRHQLVQRIVDAYDAFENKNS